MERPYEHKRDADSLLHSQKWGSPDLQDLTPAEKVERYSSPGLRRNELTPSAYREKRIAAKAWSVEDEAEYQTANA